MRPVLICARVGAMAARSDSHTRGMWPASATHAGRIRIDRIGRSRGPSFPDARASLGPRAPRPLSTAGPPADTALAPARATEGPPKCTEPTQSTPQPLSSHERPGG